MQSMDTANYDSTCNEDFFFFWIFFWIFFRALTSSGEADPRTGVYHVLLYGSFADDGKVRIGTAFPCGYLETGSWVATMRGCRYRISSRWQTRVVVGSVVTNVHL
jgi:hypothetical protein